MVSLVFLMLAQFITLSERATNSSYRADNQGNTCDNADDDKESDQHPIIMQALSNVRNWAKPDRPLSTREAWIADIRAETPKRPLSLNFGQERAGS